MRAWIRFTHIVQILGPHQMTLFRHGSVDDNRSRKVEIVGGTWIDKKNRYGIFCELQIVLFNLLKGIKIMETHVVSFILNLNFDGL